MQLVKDLCRALGLQRPVCRAFGVCEKNEPLGGSEAAQAQRRSAAQQPINGSGAGSARCSVDASHSEKPCRTQVPGDVSQKLGREANQWQVRYSMIVLPCR